MGRVNRGKKVEARVGCVGKRCVDCRHGSVCEGKVFCGWLRKVFAASVDADVEFVVCPRFEVEPLEYKVFRRA